MAFFEEFKARAAELAQAGVAKSRVLAEIAKLKAANLSEKENIHKAYLEIGRMYYAENRSNPDAAYAVHCSRITRARTAIRTNNDKITKLKEGQSNSPDAAIASVAAADAIVTDGYGFEDTP